MDIEQLAGTRLGNYEIERLIGRGGMGVIYKARQVSLNRIVALKILSPYLSSDEAFLKTFKEEARSLAKLSHENIVRVYEVEEEQGIPYLSMEYVEGRSLDEILKEELPSIDEAIRIISLAAQGIEHAHRHGIIHSYINPSKILVGPDGNVKVAFCSLCRVADRISIHCDGPISPSGPVKYMSPEQISLFPLPIRISDLQTDIWTLGIILYELLTGRLPFDTANIHPLIREILIEEPEPIRSVRKDVPTTLERVIEKMLQKNPQDRYQNMDELINDLEAVKSGKAVSTGKRSLSTPALPSFPSIKQSRLFRKRQETKRGGSTAGKRRSGISAFVIFCIIIYGARVGIKYIQHWQQRAARKKTLSETRRQHELLRILKSPGRLSGPLEAAVMEGNVESVRAFLDHGADPNLYSPRRGQSLLHTSIALGHEDITRVLLDKGADVNAKSEDSGQTPLMLATSRGEADTVNILIEKGANVSMRDNSGKRALDIAEEKGYFEIIRMIKQVRPVDSMAQ